MHVWVWVAAKHANTKNKETAWQGFLVKQANFVGVLFASSELRVCFFFLL